MEAKELKKKKNAKEHPTLKFKILGGPVGHPLLTSFLSSPPLQANHMYSEHHSARLRPHVCVFIHL
jgi:hypothetical protein